MLAGRAPRIILLRLDRQRPFSPRPSLPKPSIKVAFVPRFFPRLLNCASSLTCCFSLPSPPSTCSLGAAFARGRSEQSYKERLRVRGSSSTCSDLLPGTCHVLYCHMVQQPAFSRTVCSNTASCSWGVALEKPCGYSPLPLQLSPRKDAACSAGSS